jgi:hypothetical protein
MEGRKMVARKSKGILAWPTVAEVARQLDVGEQAVRAMIRRGDLTAVPCLDGQYYHKRIDPESLAEFIATHERRGPGDRGGVKWLRKRGS